MMHQSLSIPDSKDWGFQRKMARRVRPDSRTSVRLTPDRRRGFGRREEDRVEAALLEEKLSAALTKAEALGPKTRDWRVHSTNWPLSTITWASTWKRHRYTSAA